MCVFREKVRVKILGRDLVAAGIARLVLDSEGRRRIDKRDDRGRTVGVHALRTTFGTLLSKDGVAPRTVQAAMRHSDIRLTMGTYTDPRLLDVAGAVECLPSLPLGNGDDAGQGGLSATGTGDLPVCSLVPTLVPDSDKPAIFGVISDNQAESGASSGGAGRIAVTRYPGNRKASLTTTASEAFQSGREDLNFRPLGPEPSALARLSYAP